jgi:hypothetical protein
VFNRSVAHKRSLAIVNPVGEGGVWVCDFAGVVKIGDLLTTSDVSGHAKKQSDDIIRSYTVAKVTSNPQKWVNVPQEYLEVKKSDVNIERSFVGVVYKF